MDKEAKTSDTVVRSVNPNVDEVMDIFETEANLYSTSVTQVLRDSLTHAVINQATIMPERMIRHETLFDISDFVKGFANHSEEVYAQLIVTHPRTK